MSEFLTYTGIRMDPTQARPEQLALADVAHALSLISRGGGQLRGFYSVAQHSLACCREAAARGYSVPVQRFCLLHDASEAYLSDITRPVKAHLPDYRAIEARLQNQLYRCFAGREPGEDEAAQVRGIDDAMLYWEFLALTGAPLFDAAPEIVTAPDFSFLPFERVEAQFLAACRSLEVPDSSRSGGFSSR